MPTLHRMQTLAVAALLCATAAVSAAPVAPEVPPDTPKPVVVRTDDAPQGAAAPAASREGLRIGLSDSGTKLVLPWFVTELTDAVNQGKSAGDTAKALAQGF
ncbi:hypothetical protein [Achromobacter sp. 413638]|uniref:hypothetical protein n=1 Tax=Achromobacter sp. 413638 TaxID=3342385 RepID=UPI00370A5E12